MSQSSTSATAVSTSSRWVGDLRSLTLRASISSLSEAERVSCSVTAFPMIETDHIGDTGPTVLP